MATLNQNIAIYQLKTSWINKLTERWPLTPGYKLKQKIFKWVVRFWNNLRTFRHVYQACFPTRNIVLSIDGMYTQSQRPHCTRYYLIRTEQYRNWLNNAWDPWFTTFVSHGRHCVVILVTASPPHPYHHHQSRSKRTSILVPVFVKRGYFWKGGAKSRKMGHFFRHKSAKVGKRGKNCACIRLFYRGFHIITA